ncbi:hypothetical protein BD311DRAFT_262684 [Dichomitus squalens]|uniref:Uncharacterized protein n=1 Tax=Dichomitus squalens TaxID=114155 RepID=A0A4Q9M5D7_9APHY|nr:hypothetical protein BD311DRAFT_262684 [Dichomitus squalens]
MLMLAHTESGSYRGPQHRPSSTHRAGLSLQHNHSITSNSHGDILAASRASAHPSSSITPLRSGCQQDVFADTVLDWR